MRHHRLPLIAGAIATGLALAVAGCDVSTSVGSYDVTYRASGFTGIATIDSVLYSPGTGKCATSCNADSSLIKVTNPALSAAGIYAVELFLPTGSTVQATLYGKSTAAGTAQFTVIWMTASGTIRGDSVTTQTSATAGTPFTLSLSKRTI
ncbi:MAG TPA: hypothetical protein VMF70_05250 [Gemmatimonadales bacterium]|nr:hypothetical protein [Gemmatimonadales bacterium]